MVASIGRFTALVLGQSEAPDTSGSDPIVVIVGVLLVTAIAVFVVARRRRSES